MGTIAYTRFQLDVSYRKNNTDDLHDLGRTQTAFAHGDFSYKATVKGKNGAQLTRGGKPVKSLIFEGKLNKNGQSGDHPITITYSHIEEVNNILLVYWEIFLDGEREYDAHAKTLFDHSKEGNQISGHFVNASWSVGSFPVARMHTKLIQVGEKNYEEVIKISSGLGWYLIKQPEAFGDLVNRIYKSPSDVEWDIMVSNNPHIKNASSRATMLQAGQVIIICNTKSEKNAPLQKMKEDAKHAQIAWEKLKAKQSFSPLFFQTLDVLVGSGGKAAIAKKTEGYDPTVTWLGEITPQASYTNGGLKLWTLDSFLAFNDGVLKKTSESYANTMKAIQDTVRGGRSLNSSKLGTDALKNMSAKDIAILRSQLGNSFLRAETGIQADSLRNQLKDLAQVRSANTQGGIRNYTAFMETSGKATKALNAGGWLALGIEVYGAGGNIVDAHAEGKEVYRKAVITESLKVGVSAGGGWVGGRLGYLAGAGIVLLVGATGGGALIIIGLATVAGAGAGQIAGKMTGAAIGEGVSDNTDWGRSATDGLHDTFDPIKAANEAIKNSNNTLPAGD